MGWFAFKVHSTAKLPTKFERALHSNKSVINLCKKELCDFQSQFLQIKTIAKIIMREIDHVFIIYFI